MIKKHFDSKKVLSLILASLMIGASLAGCADTSTDETDAPTDNENTAAAGEETIPEETGPAAELHDKTYNGEEVRFMTVLHTGYDWYTNHEIYAEEMNGQHGLESPYELVHENKWTIDKTAEWKAVHNAVVMEEAAAMNFRTMMLVPGIGCIQKELLDKHYLRKHGAGAYYGQHNEDIT